MKFKVKAVSEDEVPKGTQHMPKEVVKILNDFYLGNQKAITIEMAEESEKDIVSIYYKIKTALKDKAVVRKSGKSVYIIKA
jgi:transcription initiation factor IIE alpha subunit